MNLKFLLIFCLIFSFLVKAQDSLKVQISYAPNHIIFSGILDPDDKKIPFEGHLELEEITGIFDNYYQFSGEYFYTKYKKPIALKGVASAHFLDLKLITDLGEKFTFSEAPVNIYKEATWSSADGKSYDIETNLNRERFSINFLQSQTSLWLNDKSIVLNDLIQDDFAYAAKIVWQRKIADSHEAIIQFTSPGNVGNMNGQCGGAQDYNLFYIKVNNNLIIKELDLLNLYDCRSLDPYPKFPFDYSKDEVKISFQNESKDESDKRSPIYFDKSKPEKGFYSMD